MLETVNLMTEVVERSQRKLSPGGSRRVTCAKSVLAVALAFGLSGCTPLTRDVSDSAEQVAAQITAGGVEIVERERLAAGNRTAASIPSTLAEARSVFLDHSPIVQDRLLAYEITLSDINQNEGGYSNPTLALGRFTGVGDSVKRLFEVGFSLIDLVSVPAANRALEHELTKARAQVELDLFEGLVRLEKAWVLAGVSEARFELRQYQTTFLGALAALSADYLEAGNITEVEHQARLQAYFTAQNELGLARSEANSAKSELGQLLGTPYAVFSELSVPIWSTAEHAPLEHTAAFEAARAANKHLRSVATQIPIADNLRDRLRWARWLPGLGMTIEVEKEDGTQKGPKIEVELPTFDTQSDALASMSKRAQRARQQVALLERDIEFGIGRLADQLDAEAAVLRRLEHQILPLQRKRLALRQREESYMLIDVFELAEVKLTLLEQLHELLDATERYWLDQVSLSHQKGLLLREADELVWQQFLPGGATGSQAAEKGHDHHGAHGMDRSGHDMSGSGHQMGHDGHGSDHSGYGISHGGHEMDHSGDDMSRSSHQKGHDGHGTAHSGYEISHGGHEMDHSGHDMSEGSHEMGHDQYDADHSGHGMSGSSHQIEHEAHGKDHSGHSMPQGMDPLGGEVGGIGTDHPPAASGVQEEHSSHQHRDSHERAPKQKQQVKKKASTVDGAASGH